MTKDDLLLTTKGKKAKVPKPHAPKVCKKQIFF